MTKEQKHDILQMISDIIDLEKDMSFEINSDYGDAETYYQLSDKLTKAENALEQYLENLVKDL
ncbi:hypothetical protein CPTAKMNP4_108 [Salmonella phage vB_SenM-AKM_NP4]|uniref:Uncharacterized protein n=2 Tax=Gelderlandvirus TaxID=1913653 RepID=M1EB78_BPS16|nr:hypothetical protein I133_gp161 [Salmonella phage vB_SenM-S16]YP_009126313.1 hypothetical protein STP4a_105 [Salmonella phage STP4-a]UFK27231.1 hypothetical protein LG358_00210 [Escherichia phage UoN_LG358_1]WDR21773.1 hypothetical protein PJM34_0105 [Salmonella phage vB_SenM_UTK0003]WLI71733.1 hypothetical protein CPTAKMNP4_108 [Salmonella phage vB_SenM-AKM_NP4]AEO97068.1 hypothetical protein [Salmonella phage vB_SenM-S16]AHJ86960.1 hypothetical protein STP4a_105 [Salmonella phage STP4-a]